MGAYLSDSWFPFYGSICLLSRLLPFCTLTTLSSPGVCLFLLLEFSFLLIPSRFLMLFPTDSFDMTILYKPIFGLGGGIRHMSLHFRYDVNSSMMSLQV